MGAILSHRHLISRVQLLFYSSIQGRGDGFSFNKSVVGSIMSHICIAMVMENTTVADFILGTLALVIVAGGLWMLLKGVGRLN